MSTTTILHKLLRITDISISLHSHASLSIIQFFYNLRLFSLIKSFSMQIYKKYSRKKESLSCARIITQKVFAKSINLKSFWWECLLSRVLLSYVQIWLSQITVSIEISVVIKIEDFLPKNMSYGILIGNALSEEISFVFYRNRLPSKMSSLVLYTQLILPFACCSAWWDD